MTTSLFKQSPNSRWRNNRIKRKSAESSALFIVCRTFAACRGGALFPGAFLQQLACEAPLLVKLLQAGFDLLHLLRNGKHLLIILRDLGRASFSLEGFQLFFGLMDGVFRRGSGASGACGVPIPAPCAVCIRWAWPPLEPGPQPGRPNAFPESRRNYRRIPLQPSAVR